MSGTTETTRIADQARVAQALGFYDARYAGVDEGQALLFWLPDQGSTSYDLTESGALERMARDTVERSATQDVYYNVNVLGHPVPAGKRGAVDKGDFSAVTEFVADIDIDPNRSDKPRDIDEAREFLEALPIPPSRIVLSGRGLHASWPFKEAIPIDEADHLADVQAQSQYWGRLIARRARERGWTLDNVADLARMLRPPGSWNHKPVKDGGDPRPVELVTDSGKRYLLADLVDVLPEDIADEDRGEAEVPEAGQLVLNEHERLAITEAILPYWDNGNRHHAALHMGGWLATNGVAKASTIELIEEISVHAGDADTKTKVKAAGDAYRRLKAGRRPLGWTGLKEYVRQEHLGRLDQTLRKAKGREAVDQFNAASNGATGQASNDADPAGPEDVQLPIVNVSGETLTSSTVRAWEAVKAGNDPAKVFCFGVPPVPVRVSRAGGTPSTQTLTEDRLRNHLDRAAVWVKTTAKGELVPVEPPLSIVRNMLADAAYPLPQLLAITEVPTFAPDGTYSTRAGYHAKAMTYFAPAPGFRMPDMEDPPTPATIQAARELILDELLVDFPFTGEAERANAVALLLQSFARRMIDGPTPFMLIEKPAAGTGATLLAEAIALITTGRSVGAMAEGRDEDEWRKRLTAKLRSAPSIIMIDNIRRRLDSAVVASALTATEIEDRVLGTSDNIRLPVQCAWIGTANNPSLSSEMTRRTVRIRLDAKRDRPWLREEFRHYPLMPWVRKERGNIVAACMTLVRAWVVAGRPAPSDQPALGSYESWSRTMGGILEVAGIEGFLANLNEFYEASDTEGADVRAFLNVWWEQHGAKSVLAAQLYPIAIADGSTLDLGDKSEHSQKTRLGKLVASFRDRHYQLSEDLTVCVKAGGTEHQAKTWALVASGEGGERGEVIPTQRGENNSEHASPQGGSSGKPSPTSPPSPNGATVAANGHLNGKTSAQALIDLCATVPQGVYTPSDASPDDAPDEAY